ncbi:MAG: hypothetical protein EHM20_18130 [Alphaproteobacteria bacterium]|nr:MAG: hypothetical protein EHM20_18130 [Alphaproteobacteria bacterium]
MVDAGRHKINCWVPESLWEKVESLGYDSPTKATIAGYEALIEKGNSPEEKEALGNNCAYLGNDWETLGNQLEEAQKQIKDLESASREKYAEILRLQTVIQEAPDPVELVEVRVHFEGLQKLLEEKDKRIGDLTREIEGLKENNNTLNVFAHYFKSVDFKQIEAPESEKNKPGLVSRILGKLGL